MLREKALYENAALISLVETHLRNDISDAEVKMDGYQLIRADRKAGVMKGGVANYIRNDLARMTTVIGLGSDGVVEYLVIEVKKLDIIFATVYRPPTCETSKFNHVLEIILSKVKESESARHMPNIIVMGDFNFPVINWENGTVQGGTLESQNQASSLINFMNNLTLEQCIHQPTRGNNILDLFLTNNFEIVRGVEIEDTEMSDHRLIALNVDLDLRPNENENTRQRNVLGGLNFMSDRVEWDKIKLDLGNLIWRELLEDKNPESMYDILCNKITETSIKHVPPRRAKWQNKIPRDRKILMRKRRKIALKIENERNPRTVERLKADHATVEANLIASHMEEAQKEESKLIQAIKMNNKYFYSYARNKSRIKPGIGPFEINGEVITCATQKANALREQFESVFSAPKFSTAEINSHIERERLTSMEDIVFSEEDLRSSINRLSSSSASGPDGIPAILLRKCAEELVSPLCMLWTKSMLSGKIPAKFKLAIVVPIYKDGEKHLPRNYRPVSLTSHIIKIFERVIVEKLVNFMDQKDLYNQNQHGFRKGRSCLSQLLEQHAEVLDAMCIGLATDVVYLYFAKAFDKVDHGVLLQKLANIGIGTNLLNFF